MVDANNLKVTVLGMELEFDSFAFLISTPTEVNTTGEAPVEKD